MRKRQCLNCHKAARHNSYFCTDKCGSHYADELMSGTPMHYCYTCKDYYTDGQNELHDGHKTDETVSEQVWYK